MQNLIAIEGNIGSGKTTLATQLSEALAAPSLLENFEENPFLKKYYADLENYALPVELFFLMARHKQFKNFLSLNSFSKKIFSESEKNISVADQLSKKKFPENEKNILAANDFVFSDFVFDKTKIFAQMHLENESRALFENIFSALEQVEFLPKLVLYLHRPIIELKRNIAQRGRAMEQNMPDAYLKKVETGYTQFFNTETRFPILWIDCGDTYYQPNDSVFEMLKSFLQREWGNGIHFLKI